MPIPHEADDILLQPLATSMTDAAGGLPVAGGPLHALSLRLIVLRDGRRIATRTVLAESLHDGIDGLPKALAERLTERRDKLTRTRPALPLAGRNAPLALDRPLVMGVLNVTPDSFSDGGRYAEQDRAITHGAALINAGADILDIGGESTRPGAREVSARAEIDRVRPVIEALAHEGAVLSIDSRKAAVMAAALESGAQLVNDVSALTFDPDALAVLRESGAPAVLMHAQGDPATMQASPRYDDVLVDVALYLESRLEACDAAGIDRARLIVDPGIGFGKTVMHNLTLIDGLGVLHGLGAPVLLGASRKRFIGALSREEPPDERLPGTLAASLAGLDRGAQIVRVHDVAACRQALAVRQGLRDAATLASAMAGEAA
mgnify:CR=1 FL=1